MALTITVQIDDDAQAILENDLLDIDAWVQAAVAGKINAGRKRMAREWTGRLKADPAVAMMPADDDALIAVARARPDYLNRAARDAAEARAAK